LNNKRKQYMKKYILALFTLLTILHVSMTSFADPTAGRQSDNDLLRPGQVVNYRLSLNPQETTVFLLRGDGDGDIDCVLYDDSGNEIARDTDSTDTCALRVTPRWSAVFTFRAVNNGSVISAYQFVAY
jgi:hypothetical protein